MKVDEGKIVCISYELRNGHAQGELLEVMDYNWPLHFYYGGGAMLPAFEAALFNKKPYDTFEFTLNAADAYGQKQKEKMFWISAADFIDEQGDWLSTPGAYVTVSIKENQVVGKVLEIREEGVLIDANHEMAGRDLHFKGMVIGVRNATVDEHIQKRFIEADGLRF
jgi:FKBP-type peptidyl-prolyl cis-trans isomerase SlyD